MDFLLLVIIGLAAVVCIGLAVLWIIALLYKIVIVLYEDKDVQRKEEETKSDKRFTRQDD